MPNPRPPPRLRNRDRCTAGCRHRNKCARCRCSPPQCRHCAPCASRPIRLMGDPAKTWHENWCRRARGDRQSRASPVPRVRRKALFGGGAPGRTCSKGRPPGNRRSHRPCSRARWRNSLRNRPFVFDRQVRDAPPRIEAIRRGKCIGGARALTRFAMFRSDPACDVVGFEFASVVIMQPKEQPAALPPADQIGVLALPADARGLGQRLFHDGCGVDEHLHRAAALFRRPAIAPASSGARLTTA